MTSLVVEVLHETTGSRHGRLTLGMAVMPDGEVWVVGGLGRNVILRSHDGERFVEEPLERLMKDRMDGATGLRTISARDGAIWICGEWGYVGVSEDGGETWRRIPTGQQNCCWSLAHDAAGNVWATADNGWVGYCTDGETFASVQRGVSCRREETWKHTYGMPGGIAWCEATPRGVLLPAGERLLVGHEGVVEILGLEAGAKVSHAIVTPSGALVAATHDGVFRSDDEGATFERGRMPRRGSRRLHRVRAFESGELLATGDDVLLHSEDDGRSWSPVPHPFFEKYKPRDRWLYALGAHGGGLLVGGEGGLVARVSPVVGGDALEFD